jgi:4'-phosphopantetheinyl transferase EntD
MFLRNVVWLVRYYKALYPRRHNLKLFHSEDGGDMFLRNVVWLVRYYKALYPRRYKLEQYLHYIVERNSDNKNGKKNPMSVCVAVSTVQAARHMFRILHTRQAGLCVGGK